MVYWVQVEGNMKNQELYGDIEREITRVHDCIALEKEIERRFPGALTAAHDFLYERTFSSQESLPDDISNFQRMEMFHSALQFTVTDTLTCTTDSDEEFTWDVDQGTWVNDDGEDQHIDSVEES